VTLCGIDSVMCPAPRRAEAWTRLAKDLDLGLLDSMTTHAGLSDVPDLAVAILDGKVRGRVVVDVNG
jgi:acrylyl-CoA reductase (NADPH)